MTNLETAPPWEFLPHGRLEEARWKPFDVAIVLVLALVTLPLLVTLASIGLALAGLSGSAHPNRVLEAGLILTFLFELCLLGIAAGFSVGKYGVSWRRYGFRSFPKKESFWWPVGIVGSYFIVGIYVALVSALHLSVFKPSPDLPQGIFNTKTLIVMSGVEACLIAPVIEESFFRGFLFHGLVGKRIPLAWIGIDRSFHSGFWTAALASGFVFAAFHTQVGLLIPFTGVGVLFAWIFYRTGSLWPNILTHASFNLISFAFSLAAHH